MGKWLVMWRGSLCVTVNFGEDSVLCRFRWGRSCRPPTSRSPLVRMVFGCRGRLGDLQICALNGLVISPEPAADGCPQQGSPPPRMPPARRSVSTGLSPERRSPPRLCLSVADPGAPPHPGGPRADHSPLACSPDVPLHRPRRARPFRHRVVRAMAVGRPYRRAASAALGSPLLTVTYRRTPWRPAGITLAIEERHLLRRAQQHVVISSTDLRTRCPPASRWPARRPARWPRSAKAWSSTR